MSGDFDGLRFLPDTDLHGKPIWQWVDHGRDFYAAVGWNGGPPGDDGRYWIGWMGNHRYQNDLPETGWRGAMSLARRLSFCEQDGVYRLVQQPMAPDTANFEPCIGGPISLAAGEVMQLGTGLPRAFACRVHFASGAGTMIIGAGQGKIRIAFDASARTITCDRALAGSMQDDADFCRPMSAPWLDPSAPVMLWVDDHSLEIFADSGTTAMTVQSFLTPGPIDLMLDSSASASHWQDISIAPVLGEWAAGD
jgi:fructan beta-fructosidase